MIHKFLSSGSHLDQPELERLNDRMSQFYAQASEASYWETSEATNEEWHPISHKFHHYLRNLIAPNDKVVDFGCGSAHPARHLGNPQRYTGIDWGEKQTKINQLNYPDADFICSDIYTTPLLENSVDWAVSFYVLEHCVWPQKMLDEMYRVVRPGGCVAIICPNCRPHMMPSMWSGLTASPSVRKKIQRFNIPDVILHVLDKKLFFPNYCRSSHLEKGEFLIYSEPACLYSDWRPDTDAVYWADQPEVINYLTSKGGSVVADRDSVDKTATGTLFCVVRK